MLNAVTQIVSLSQGSEGNGFRILRRSRQIHPKELAVPSHRPAPVQQLFHSLPLRTSIANALVHHSLQPFASAYNSCHCLPQRTPAIILRLLHNSSAHWIKIDIRRHDAGSPSTLHQRGAKAIFPQCSRAVMSLVKPAREALLERPHELREIPHAFEDPCPQSFSCPVVILFAKQSELRRDLPQLIRGVEQSQVFE